MREVVSNILAHRDFSNAYTAKLIIERDKIYTENSNLPHGHGELQLNKFEPFPKNPTISKVFREIGYADELGSGMRNTNKYTKLYSGGTPIFEEGNVFKITIPLENVAELQVGPGSNKENDKENNIENNKEIENKIIAVLQEKPEASIKEISKTLDLSIGSVRHHIEKLKKRNMVKHVGSTKKGRWIIK